MGKKRAKGSRKASSRPAKAQKTLEALRGVPQPAAAWVLGISARSLRDLADAPRKADGDYDLRTLVAWWSEREKRKIGGPSPALERIREAKASAAERKNAIESGRLVDIEDAAHTAQWVWSTFNSQLEGALSAGTAVQPAEIRSAIDRAREQLAQAFDGRTSAPAGTQAALPFLEQKKA